MGHQALENALKGYLAALDMHYDRTHNLLALMEPVDALADSALKQPCLIRPDCRLPSALMQTLREIKSRIERSTPRDILRGSNEECLLGPNGLRSRG